MKKLILFLLFIGISYLTLKFISPYLGFDFKDFIPSSRLVGIWLWLTYGQLIT